MNRHYEDYTQLAYRQSILQAVRRFVVAHIEGEDEALTCETVFTADRIVPEGAWMSFLKEVQQQEVDIQKEMDEYEFQRKQKAEGKKKQRHHGSQ